MAGVDTADHWSDFHDINCVDLKALSSSIQVKELNKALEDYEDGTEPVENRSFDPNCSESKFQSSVSETKPPAVTVPSNKDIETKLNSFETKLDDISVTMKHLASATAACIDKVAAIPDINTAIAKISASQAEQGSKIETMSSAIGQARRSETASFAAKK